MKNIIVLIISSCHVSCAAVPGDPSFIPEKSYPKIMHITKITPDWFKKPLTSESAIYATATAVSEDYQMSVKKATLYAKAELADKIKGNIKTLDRTMSVEKYIEKKPGKNKSEERGQNLSRSYHTDTLVLTVAGCN